MSGKSVVVLDTVLLVLIVLLVAPRFTGLAIHEWLGLVLMLPVLLHLLLSWNWISDIIRNFFATTLRQRVNFALNALFFVLVVLEVVSGLGISHVALPLFGVPAMDDRAWRALHNEFLGWLRLLVGLHIAVNWNWIAAAARRWRKPPVPPGGNSGAGWGRAAARALLIIFAAALIAGLVAWRLGVPSMARRYPQDEIARFAGAYRWGVFQLVAQICMLGLVAFIGRRWLRARL